MIASGRYAIAADDGSKTVFRFLDRSHTGVISASGDIGYHGPGQTYIKPWAPRQPYKIVIRDAGRGRVPLYGAMCLVVGIAVIAYVVYKKRQTSMKL